MQTDRKREATKLILRMLATKKGKKEQQKPEGKQARKYKTMQCDCQNWATKKAGKQAGKSQQGMEVRKQQSKKAKARISASINTTRK